MVISFFEATDKEKKYFKKAFPEHTLNFFDKTIQDVPVKDYENSDILCVFIYSTVNEAILSQCKKLKLVCTRSTGIDHIDINYCKEKNIPVKNVPFYGENTVAEHTFALLLAISRKIKSSRMRVESGSFSTEGLQGFDLKNKTIGLIGGGRIGMHVARMAGSFSMNVLVYDINQDSFLADILNFKYVSLDDLLKHSDIISLHVPYNKYTEHIINKDTISKMKKGVVVINTARGGLLDTDSLVAAIENGKVLGAGLDVIEGEELLVEENIFNSPVEKAAKLIIQSKKLLDNENVVITPHNAFNSVEALERILETTADNIKAIS